MSEAYWSVYYECPLCWAGDLVRVTDGLHPERYPCSCGHERVLTSHRCYTETAFGDDWVPLWESYRQDERHD